ncbi:anti-sigma factor [Diaminobutyricibacter sp. McL0608]|uniref:anti-sigma factor n=1 Tax=Leifsonia sp. McL0608 TaxID=3143537 RepID=UPI0031F2FCCD
MTDREDRSPLHSGYRMGAETPDEAAEFAEVATQLGLAAEPVEPPPALKAGIMAKLATTPQLAPEAVEGAHASDAVPEVDADSRAIEPPDPAETRARARWFTRPIAIAAAAAAALVLFVGGVFVGSAISGNNSFEAQQAASLAEINSAADVQHTTSPVVGGGTATLVWSGDLGKSALVTTGLPQLPDDKTYELWYIRGSEATPAGTMAPSGNGATWRVLEGTMSAGDSVGVTVEPKGGSKQPTTKPIVAIQS